jgi:3-isopropylmalate/(R)-2-methylmalate dehydratase small subunit
VPLKRSDVDTDQIIPAEWLKRVERTGFEKGLFATWRDDRDFVLNQEQYQGASILVAGPAFGVGSSREHAVWAIQQGGFDAVIAPSFSDIFRNNCTKNADPCCPSRSSRSCGDHRGPTRPRRSWSTWSADGRGAGNRSGSFSMEPHQHRFLNGLDDVGITLTHVDEITSFEQHRPAWLG